MTEDSRIADAVTSLERRVAALIADMRGRRGLGQAELAALIGNTGESIARLESGEPGYAATLATLAEIAHQLDFHVTLDLHDRQPQASVPDAGQDAIARLGTVSLALDGGIQLGSAPDIILGDDVAITIPDEPDNSFLLDDSAAGITVQKHRDDTFSPSGGDDGFSDGMNG